MYQCDVNTNKDKISVVNVVSLVSKYRTFGLKSKMTEHFVNQTSASIFQFITKAC